MNSSDEEERAAPPLTERAALYRVALEVCLLPGHPQYWKCGPGILFMWLYADSAKGATATATQVLYSLPYELSSESPTEAGQQFEIQEYLARGSGLALLFATTPVGTDESEFETAAPA